MDDEGVDITFVILKELDHCDEFDISFQTYDGTGSLVYAAGHLGKINLITNSFFVKNESLPCYIKHVIKIATRVNTFSSRPTGLGVNYRHKNNNKRKNS